MAAVYMVGGAASGSGSRADSVLREEQCVSSGDLVRREEMDHLVLVFGSRTTIHVARGWCYRL